MLLVCPRCSGSLQPDARACPRCGLVLTNLSTEAGGATETISPNGREPYSDLYPTPETVAQPGHVEQVAYAPGPQGTAEYTPPESSSFQVPMRPIARPPEPYGAASATTRVTTDGSALLVPRGAAGMLPNESVVFQLGAVYLTNKRV